MNKFLTMFMEEDKETWSSRRVAGFYYPSLLFIMAIVIAIIGITTGITVWYPYAVAGGLFVLGVVVILFLFNLINATDIKETITNITKKD